MGHDYYLYGQKMYITNNFYNLHPIVFTIHDFHQKSGNRIVKMICYNCHLLEKYWGIKETLVDKTNKSYWWGVHASSQGMVLLDKLKVYYNYMHEMIRIINEHNSLSPDSRYIETHNYVFTINSDQCNNYPNEQIDSFNLQLIKRIKNNMLLSCMLNMLTPITPKSIYFLDDILKVFIGYIMLDNPSTFISCADVFFKSDEYLYELLLAGHGKVLPVQQKARTTLTKYKRYLRFTRTKNQKIKK